MTRWHRVLPDAELATGALHGFEVDGKRLVLLRGEAGLRVFDDQCPHRGAPFSDVGRLSDGRLLCGWHFWAFDADTGAHTHLPTVCLVRYRVRVTDGVVEVELEG